MSSLLEQLQAIDSAITPAQVADLRAGLVAINRQTQSQPDSTAWSLTRWCQWLDDEGYSRDDLLETLNGLGLSVLGPQVWAQQTDLFLSCGEESQGLQLLQELLEQRDPELLTRLHRLEAAALAEDTALTQRAGGASKVLKDGLIALGGATVVGCLYYAHHNYKEYKKLQRQLAEVLDQEAKAVEHQAVVDDRAAREDVRLAETNTKVAASDVLSEAEKDPTATLAKLAMLNRDVFQNRKDIATYTAQDVDVRATVLVAEHTLMYVGKAVEAQIVDELKNSLEFRQKVMEVATSDQGIDDVMENLGAIPNANEIAVAEQTVMNGDWFAEAKVALKNTGLESRLRNQEVKKAYDAYHSLVSREVAAAQAQLAEDADNPFYAATMGEAKAFIGYSEVKVNAEITRLAAEAEAGLRDTEDAAVRVARDSDRLL